MELNLNKDEYIVGYARIAGGILFLTNSRLLIDRGFRIFGEKTKSIRIKDICDLKLNKSFLFGTNIDIKYLDENKEHTVFFDFIDPAKAEEFIDKIRSLQNGEILMQVEVPKGEMGGISLEEAEQTALNFMEKRTPDLKVDEIKHIAGAWNVILSNHDKYAVVVGDDGKVEAWKKINRFG